VTHLKILPIVSTVLSKQQMKLGASNAAVRSGLRCAELQVTCNEIKGVMNRAELDYPCLVISFIPTSDGAIQTRHTDPEIL
jgi:hypothetical protein